MATQTGINPRIVVVGAGWAGLAAAWKLTERLPDAGAVTLVERKRFPGGRAFSFRDSTTGFQLDNGQHILLGCCTSATAFLQGIGLPHAVRFQPLLDIPVYCDGQWSRLSSSALPGPLHILPTLLRYRHLSPAERFKALMMAGALKSNPKSLDNISFFDWLRDHRQSETSIRRLWELIGVSVLNTRAKEASAAQAVQAFQMGVISNWRAARLGYFQVPLGEVALRAWKVLRERGVSLNMGQAVTSVRISNGRVAGVQLSDGTSLDADVVVTALPPQALLGVLPEDIQRQPFFSELSALQWSPIFNVDVLLDRKVMEGEVAAFAEGTSQFVFNRGRLMRAPSIDGKLLTVSVSAAQELRNQPRNRLIHVVLEELRKAFPIARSAQVVAATCIWQRQATFLQSMGSAALRRSSRTPIGGLLIAGDWTATGWPASLEGAVRSGEAVAQLVAELPEMAEKNGHGLS